MHWRCSYPAVTYYVLPINGKIDTFILLLFTYPKLGF